MLRNPSSAGVHGEFNRAGARTLISAVSAWWTWRRRAPSTIYCRERKMYEREEEAGVAALTCGRRFTCTRLIPAGGVTSRAQP